MKPGLRRHLHPPTPHSLPQLRPQFTKARPQLAFTHQKDYSWVTNQSQGCRQLPFVASAVGTRGSVCIARKTQAHQARKRSLRSRAG